MNGEHFGEGFVKGFVYSLLQEVNTVKAFWECRYAFACNSFYSLSSKYIIWDTYPKSLHTVHLSKESVHESVHKVFTEVFTFGGVLVA